MDTLAEHIERRLKERAFCIVFEDEIERFWPRKNLASAEREKQIQAFAKSHGWNGLIHNSKGLSRAIFLHP